MNNSVFRGERDEQRSEPKREYKRRVVEAIAYPANGERALAKEQVRRLLGIRHRSTINDHLAQMGLDPYMRAINWSTVRHIVGAQLWCQVRPGSHSKRQYANLQAMEVEELQGQPFGEYVLQNQYNLSVEERINALENQFLSETNHHVG